MAFLLSVLFTLQSKVDGTLEGLSRHTPLFRQMMEFLMSKHMTLCFGLFFADFGLVYACSRMRYSGARAPCPRPTCSKGLRGTSLDLKQA